MTKEYYYQDYRTIELLHNLESDKYSKLSDVLKDLNDLGEIIFKDVYKNGLKETI
jgi:hypothetical protein